MSMSTTIPIFLLVRLHVSCVRAALSTPVFVNGKYFPKCVQIILLVPDALLRNIVHCSTLPIATTHIHLCSNVFT
jgi:hypothetical protein